MRAIFLCYDPDQVRCKDGLSALLRKLNIPSSSTFEKGRLQHALQAYSERGGDCVLTVCDYPLDDQKDIDTLEAFMRHSLDNKGNFFYIPRPNPHLHVQDAALTSYSDGKLPKETPSRSIIARAFRRLAGIKRLFPTTEEEAAATDIAVAAAAKGEPAPVIPASLPQDLKWTEWNAPADVLRRDLVDRVERFYPFPRALHMIVANQCNLKCVMCSYHSPKYRPHHTSDYFSRKLFMSDETFEKVLVDVSRYKTPLQFGQIEEPLINPNIFKFIRKAKDKGCPFIHMTTNGTLLTKERANELLDAGLNSIMFSIDAVSKETYKEIRGADMEALERNLAYYIPLAKKAGTRIKVSFILNPQAKPERDAFMEKWRNAGVDDITFYGLYEHDPKTGRIVNVKSNYVRSGKRYPCAAPWIQTAVFPSGEISFCCKTMVDLGWRGIVAAGDLRTDGLLSDIWTGRGYRVLRNAMLDMDFKDYNVCEDCNIWSASTYIHEKHPSYKRYYNETLDVYEFLHNKG